VEGYPRMANNLPSYIQKSDRGRKRKKSSDDSKINLNESAVQLIDSITAMLVELRNELQKTDL
jgi:hypothetical protein